MVFGKQKKILAYKETVNEVTAPGKGRGTTA
jgi:hypothetical protein